MVKHMGFPCRYMLFNPFRYHSCARARRVTFEVWNKGNAVTKLSSIQGIAYNKEGNPIPPLANEPGDLIPSGKRKPVSLNFKCYNKNYEEIIIIKTDNEQIELEVFTISCYLKGNRA